MQIVAGLLLETIERLGAMAASRVVACRENFSRTYRSCLVLQQQLPFANSSLNSSSNSEPESITEEQNITSVWTEFDNRAIYTRKNKTPTFRINGTAWLAQLGERRAAEREVMYWSNRSSNMPPPPPGHTPGI